MPGLQLELPGRRKDVVSFILYIFFGASAVNLPGRREGVVIFILYIVLSASASLRCKKIPRWRSDKDLKEMR